jgi:AraC-like DNA-binding protein
MAAAAGGRPMHRVAMKPELTVSNALITAILDGLPLSEAEKGLLLEQAGLLPEHVRDINERTTLAVFQRLWAGILRRTDDEFVGVRIGDTISGSRFGLASHVTQNSLDLRQALGRFSRYAGLINDLILCTLEETAGTARLTMRFHWDILDLERHAVDIAFVVIVKWARQQVGARFRLHQVRLRHTHRSAQARYEEIFQAPVVLGCGRNELVFGPAALDEIIPGSDLELGQILDRYATAEISTVPVLTDLPSRVSQILTLQLRSGKVADLQRVCEELKLPERQLQRRLREASTTFSLLLEEARRSLAPDLLVAPAANVEQVGFQLGYSEPTAFIRAFRKWYDMTPGQYRKAKR